MSETLSFPGLGLEFTLNRVAFSIGPLTVYWYGVIIALAFLAGITYVLLRVKHFGLDGDRVIDVILGGAIGSIIGARLYFVIFSWDQFRDNLWDIFNIRQGGIAIYGGIIGGFLAGLLMCRLRRVKALPMLDLAVGGLILGQAIGRWGNFVNIEAFGGNTSLPWGMTSPSIVNFLDANRTNLAGINMAVDPSMPVHPTFFYESVWCLLGFLFIAWYTRRRRFDGELLLIYSAWYGLGRAVIEGLRTDSLLIGTIRVSQLLAILCVIASVVIWGAVRSRINRSGDPEYLRLYVDTDEGQMILAGTFYQKKKKASDAPAQVAPEAQEPLETQEASEMQEVPEAQEEPETPGENGGEQKPNDNE
ncbi:prolipoprotein diacylglyceryl transferase [Harryflintia acetispora]|uniref:Phosphatidylglycerol--prolipoprotein diacylglyceryl transferase n=1 Tax=Harryflintia acetispora TaxID=1849041 RepID=A0A9X8UJR9_9FIRM|nr:prolipoprotein diacylglyceryl transferase [Harryflintia acetispora]TCL43554.1 phosphatidylglycerol:prolipoprotein diacylglycerol transferase [Harryflintia acetispora]